jgi:hypothetical protein
MDSLPVDEFVTTIHHDLLMLCNLGQHSTHSLGTNDYEMERSFDLLQYVETTLQFPSASECTHLLILAMTLDMLFQCKPGPPCNVNMSGELESQQTEK